MKKTKKEQALRKEFEEEFGEVIEKEIEITLKEISDLEVKIRGFLFDKFGDRTTHVMMHALVKCACLILYCQQDLSISEKREEIELLMKIMKDHMNEKYKR